MITETANIQVTDAHGQTVSKAFDFTYSEYPLSRFWRMYATSTDLGDGYMNLNQIALRTQPGGELKVETTICHEIRQSGEGGIIDHVAQDQAFCHRPTPAMYGFQSYISIPIVRAGGVFFGTLCAIDPRPMQLNRAEIIHMFKLFAELIARINATLGTVKIGLPSRTALQLVINCWSVIGDNSFIAFAMLLSSISSTSARLFGCVGGGNSGAGTVSACASSAIEPGICAMCSASCPSVIDLA